MKPHVDISPRLRGLDLRNGPRTFTYDLRRLRRERATLRLMPVVVIAGVAYVLGPRIPGVIREMGWGVGLSALAMLVLFMGSYLTMFMAMLPALDDAINRAGERMTVSEDGIRWEGGGRVVEAAWKDVMACRRADVGTWFRLDRLRVVETTHGPIVYNAHIDSTGTLSAAILHYSDGPAWLRSESELLGVSPTSRESLDGGRTYHYRTRSVRAMLILISMLPAAHLAVYALARNGWLDRPSGDLTLTNIFLLLPVAYAWWRYWVGRVVLDERGVTQQGLFGPKTIVWSEVRAVRTGGGRPPSWAIVEGAGTHLVISMFLVDAGEMLAEIRRRAGLSVPPGTPQGLD